MNAVSQRMRVKTAETFPAAEVWNSPENFFLNDPLIVFDTRALLRLPEGQDRDSALTSLRDHVLRRRVSLVAQPWGQSHSFENYFTEFLRKLAVTHMRYRIERSSHSGQQGCLGCNNRPRQAS
jgi:hypothetical protein